MKACFHIAECRLSYAKIVQMRAMKACFHIAECRLSYAKVKFFLLKKKLEELKKLKPLPRRSPDPLLLKN